LEERILLDGTSDDAEHKLAEVRRALMAAAAGWEHFGLPAPQGWPSLGTSWEAHRSQVPDYLQSIGLP
jgi:hypothetical protein